MSLEDDPRVLAARNMRREGRTLREIAAHFGVSKPTVHRWTTPGESERLRELARRWKRDHPDTNREITERWKRSPNGRGLCPHCGGLKGVGMAQKAKQCMGCFRATAAVRTAIVEALWEQGLSYPELIDWTGLPRGSISKIVHDGQAAGRLDYRYSTERRQAVAEAIRVTA